MDHTLQMGLLVLSLTHLIYGFFFAMSPIARSIKWSGTIPPVYWEGDMAVGARMFLLLFAGCGPKVE